jgi:Family of unknown function (DUF6039)
VGAKTLTQPVAFTAQQQTSVPAESLLTSANAGVIIERMADIRGGYGTRARAAVREACERLNTQFVGHASALIFEETFGFRDRLHVILHLRSFDDYEMLLHSGGSDADFRNGVFGGHGRDADLWDTMFVEGSVRDLVMQPHRWGMHGTLTEGMIKDPAVTPVEDDPSGLARFAVKPAQEQTALAPQDIVHTGNSGIVLRRTADFDYEFRNEARVFARAIAETVNLNMKGLATLFLYEEDFGSMDRLHWYIHMRSMSVYYLLMGLDTSTGPDAPRVSFIQDWISMEKGSGSWERMLVQGSVKDVALTPQYLPGA